MPYTADEIIKRLETFGIRARQGIGGQPLLNLPGQTVDIAPTGQINPVTGRTVGREERLSSLLDRWDVQVNRMLHGQPGTPEERWGAGSGRTSMADVIREDLAEDPRWPHNMTVAQMVRRSQQLTVTYDRELDAGTYPMNPFAVSEYEASRGYYYRPGSADEDYGPDADPTRRLPARAFPISTLAAITGVVRRGEETWFGTDTSKVPKHSQLAFHEYVGLAGMQERESSLIAQSAPQPERGYVLNTFYAMNAPMLSGLGWGRPGLSPTGARTERIPVPKESLPWLKLGDASEDQPLVSTRANPAVAFQIGNIPYHAPLPRNWDTSAVTGVRLMGEDEKYPYVEMDLAYQGGGFSLKDISGIKSQIATVGGMARSIFHRPGSLAGLDIVVGGADIKNWRMNAAGVLGAMGVGDITRRAKGLGYDLSPETLTDDEGNAQQRIRWGPDNDAALRDVYLQFAQENWMETQMTIPIARGNMGPFYMAMAMRKLSPEIRDKILPKLPWLKKFDMPALEGFTQTSPESFAATFNAQGPYMPTLHQAMREWEYGKTRLNLEEMAHLRAEDPAFARRIETRAQRLREPWAQTIRLARFERQEIGIGGLGYTMPAGDVNWAEIGESAMQSSGLPYGAIPPSYLAKTAATRWDVAAEKAGLGPGTNVMMEFETSQGSRYLPSPGAMVHLGAAGMNINALLIAYQRAQSAGVAMQGAMETGAERKFLAEYGNFSRTLQKYVDQPGVQRRATEFPLEWAAEGTYVGSLALNPGEFIFGRQRLEKLWPQLGDPKSYEAFQNMLESNVLFMRGHRRPYSDPGQIGAFGMMLSANEYRKRGGELELGGNELVVSWAASNLNRGDFDADRFLAIMQTMVRFDNKGAPRFSTPAEVHKALGTWDEDAGAYVPREGDVGFMRGAVSQLLGSRAIAGLAATAPGGWQSRINELRGLGMEDVIRRELRATHMPDEEVEAWMGGGDRTGLMDLFVHNQLLGGRGVASLEAAKTLGDWAKFPDMASALTAARASFEKKATDEEILGASQVELASKDLMMGLTFNLQRDWGKHLGIEGKRALAEGYQTAIDRTMPSLGLRRYLSIMAGYAGVGRDDPTSPTGYRQPGGMSYKFLSTEERAQLGDSHFLNRGPAGLMDEVAASLRQTTEFPADVMAQLFSTTPEMRDKVQTILEGGKGMLAEAWGSPEEFLKTPGGQSLWAAIGARAPGRLSEREQLTESGIEAVKRGREQRAWYETIKPKGGPVSELVQKFGMLGPQGPEAAALAKTIVGQLGGPGKPGSLSPEEVARGQALRGLGLSPEEVGQYHTAASASLKQLNIRTPIGWLGAENLEYQLRTSIAERLKYVSGSQLRDVEPGTAPGHALSNLVSYAMASLYGGQKHAVPNTLAPSSREAMLGTEIHTGWQKLEFPQFINKTTGQFMEEEIRGSKKFRDLFGQEFVGHLDVPLAAGVGLMDIKPGTFDKLDISADEYREAVRRQFAEDPHHRRQLSGYHYAVNDPRAGLMMYPRSLRDTPEKAVEWLHDMWGKLGQKPVDVSDLLLNEEEMRTVVGKTTEAAHRVGQRALELSYNVMSGIEHVPGGMKAMTRDVIGWWRNMAASRSGAEARAQIFREQGIEEGQLIEAMKTATPEELAALTTKGLRPKPGENVLWMDVETGGVHAQAMRDAAGAGFGPNPILEAAWVAGGKTFSRMVQPGAGTVLDPDEGWLKIHEGEPGGRERYDPRTPGWAQKTGAWKEATVIRKLQETIARATAAGKPFTAIGGHNVPFDREFLQEAAKRAGVRLDLPSEVKDTLQLSRQIAALGIGYSPKSHTLSDVAEALGIPVAGAHGAGADVQLAQRVYQALTDILPGGLTGSIPASPPAQEPAAPAGGAPAEPGAPTPPTQTAGGGGSYVPPPPNAPAGMNTIPWPEQFSGKGPVVRQVGGQNVVLVPSGQQGFAFMATLPQGKRQELNIPGVGMYQVQDTGMSVGIRELGPAQGDAFTIKQTSAGWQKLPAGIQDTLHEMMRAENRLTTQPREGMESIDAQLKAVQEFVTAIRGGTEGVKKYAEAHKMSVKDFREASLQHVQALKDILPLSQHISGYLGMVNQNFQEAVKNLAAPKEGETAEEAAARTKVYDFLTKDRWSIMGRNETAELALKELSAFAQPEQLGKIQKATGALHDLLSEFSIGGAAIKMAVVGRVTTGLAGGWAQAAEPYEAAGMGFGLAMGGTLQEAMGGTYGQMVAQRARMANVTTGLGLSVERQRVGAMELLGFEPTLAGGEQLGALIGPPLQGMGVGLMAGVGVDALAGIVGKAGLKAGPALAAMGPQVALAGFAGTTALLTAGQIQQAGTPAAFMRELATAEAQGRTITKPEDMSFWSFAAYDVKRAWQFVTGKNRQIGGAGDDEWGRRRGEAMSSKEFAHTAAGEYLLAHDKLKGLKAEQVMSLGSYLNMMGYSAEDILAGNADAAIEQMAPMAMAGLAEAAVSNAQRVAANLGISPGQGLRPYLAAMPTAGDIAGTESWVRASQIMGRAGAEVGQTPTVAEISTAASQLRSGMKDWQLELNQMRYYGEMPSVQALGLTEGSSKAITLSQRARAGSLAQARGVAQIAGQLQGLGELRGMSEVDIQSWAERMEADVNRQGGPTLASSLRAASLRTGAGGVAQAFGYAPGTARAIALESPYAGIGAAGLGELQMAAAPAAQVYGYRGTGAAGLLGQFYGMVQAGATPMGMSAVADAMQGRDALAQALGMPSGWASMMPATEALQYGVPVEDYQKKVAIANFGMSQMGYSMMATKGNALGEAMSKLFGMWGAQGYGPGAPTGRPLIDVATGYGVHAQELMGIQRSLQYAGQDWQRTQWGFQEQGIQAQKAYQGDYLAGTGTQGYQWANINAQIAHQQELIQYTKDMRDVLHEMVDLQRQQQKAAWVRQEAGMELGLQQQLENLGAQREMWGVNTTYQRRVMGMQWSQMQTRQEWATQDMAWQREQMGFDYEWQMGKLQRQLRMATGPQKLELIREKEHAEEVYARQTTRAGTEESRTRQQMAWENEAFRLQRNHFEQVAQLQKKQFDMQERHILERYGLEKKQLEEVKKDMQAMWALEDKRRKMEEDWQDKTQKWQMEELQRTRAYYEDVVFPHQNQQLKMQEDQLKATRAYYEGTVFPAQNQQLKLQQDLQAREAEYTLNQIRQFSPGGALYDAWIKFIDEMTAKLSSADNAAAAADAPPPNPNPTGPQPDQAINLVVEDGVQLKAYLVGTTDRAAKRTKQAGGWGRPWGS